MSASESVQSPMTKTILSILLCFGGGVILTSCLTHMLPDVNEVAAAAMDNGSFPATELPVGEILVIAGFLMIYLLEEVTHFVISRFIHLGTLKPTSHSHYHNTVLKRSHLS